MNISTVKKTVIFIIFSMLILLVSKVISMTEEQIADEGRMADKYGSR